MAWHYQATHRTVTMPGGEVEDVFEVREVRDDDGKFSWTENAIAPDSDTKEGLIDVLQMMLKDVRDQFGVLEVGE